ncbi:Crp/Fnr family transcriptional regulator [Ottowia sp.]|uniref:Crp/Fnr family transcriptional regulator n=1 Tax=Ottowia sp. TaxID=1898956 RepID=UPI003A8BE852
MHASILPNRPDSVATLPQGSLVLQRGTPITHVDHVDEGRIAIGLLEQGQLAHRMGTIQGPCWLNASCVVLGMTPLVDAVAETAVQVRRIPLEQFNAELQSMPESARSVLFDIAKAHRLQTELAVSRLSKDAEARCAEWLLRHAEPASHTPGELTVMLRQRKRLIAAQLGIAPETFSRVLRQLREQSLISGSGRELNLLDLNGLRTLARI